MEKKPLLFTVGPVQMFERTLKVKSFPIPYFRTKNFSKILLDTQNKILKLVGAPKGSKVVSLTTSGSGGMEGSIINLFNKNDKLLLINGGTFGQRFVDIVKTYKIPFDELIIEKDKDLTKEDLQKYEKNLYSGVIVNINETSLGKLYDINLLKTFAIKHKALFVVDAVSAFLNDPIDMEKDNIDAYIFASQKGVSVSPGMSFVILSKKAQDKMKQITCPSFYLDFKKYFEYAEVGQTPFTPSIGTLFEINDMADLILKTGKNKWVSQIKNNAKYFRKSISKLGFEIPAFNKSNALTLVLCPKNNAKKIINYLEKQTIYVSVCYGDLENKAFRVSHMGNLKKSDYNFLCKVISKFLKKNE